MSGIQKLVITEKPIETLLVMAGGMINKFIFCFLCVSFSYKVNAVEDIKFNNNEPKLDIIPYQFVVDVGASASAYSNKPGEQYYFIQSYASTLEEILIDGLTYSDFEEDTSNCKKSKSKSYKLESCARIAAARAVFKKKLPLAFTNFGYENRQLNGILVKDSSDAPHEFLTIKTVGGDVFQVFENKDTNLPEGIKCTFDGFLSPAGSYGSRGRVPKRAFFVMSSNCPDK